MNPTPNRRSTLNATKTMVYVERTSWVALEDVRVLQLRSPRFGFLRFTEPMAVVLVNSHPGSLRSISSRILRQSRNIVLSDQGTRKIMYHKNDPTYTVEIKNHQRVAADGVQQSILAVSATVGSNFVIEYRNSTVAARPC